MTSDPLSHKSSPRPADTLHIIKSPLCRIIGISALSVLRRAIFLAFSLDAVGWDDFYSQRYDNLNNWFLRLAARISIIITACLVIVLETFRGAKVGEHCF